MNPSRFDSIHLSLRQAIYPRDFRICEPTWPRSWLETLRELIDLPPPPVDKARMRFLADLATGVWRLRQKMLEPGTDRPKEQFRREYRHLESVWDVLTQAGFEIQDHTGKPFDSGQALKVLSCQPKPGVIRERVQDTIKPTIYFKEQHIQIGEVIVETPDKGDSNSVTEAASNSPTSEEK